jgi:polysaccharide deacetylase family protein (PEP-CTERM system associated)
MDNEREKDARELNSIAGSTIDQDGSREGSEHLLTVVLEDYFHVAPLKSVVQTDQWYRFERRVEANTHKALDLLEDFDVTATFFVLGSIADEMPELVREVADRGHEIASKGYIHRSIRHFGSPAEFRDDLVRSREALESASGTSVHGYRIGHRWFSPEDLWALDVLVEENFSFDSSVRPLFRRYAGAPEQRLPHVHRYRGGQIWEFPLPAMTVMGWSLPISGGNYLRQFPHWMMRRAVDSWARSHDFPFLMYFHVWELDPDQPRIQAAPLRERIRQYRNLDKMYEIIRFYLGRYRFSGIGRHLGLTTTRASAAKSAGSVVTFDQSADEPTDPGLVVPDSERVAISIVVPCFNEELILPYLANTLASVEKKLKKRYDLQFVFVDDGSTDGTWRSLRSIFGDRSNCRLCRHKENRGVAAAIMTGVREAETEVVCSIDCDCTYDPHQLKKLIPLLGDDVDVVTASPYHAQGTVRNVPSWRLFLSKSLSNLYRLVLHHSLATYTSCFRVYRRSAIVDVAVREGGFLGVAEMLGVLDLQGGKIVECPAVLEVRLLGRSKMKTLKTIIGHLGLLARLAADRAFGRRRPPASPDADGRTV